MHAFENFNFFYNYYKFISFRNRQLFTFMSTSVHFKPRITVDYFFHRYDNFQTDFLKNSLKIKELSMAYISIWKSISTLFDTEKMVKITNFFFSDNILKTNILKTKKINLFLSIGSFTKRIVVSFFLQTALIQVVKKYLLVMMQLLNLLNFNKSNFIFFKELNLKTFFLKKFFNSRFNNFSFNNDLFLTSINSEKNLLLLDELYREKKDVTLFFKFTLNLLFSKFKMNSTFYYTDNVFFFNKKSNNCTNVIKRNNALINFLYSATIDI